jgi:hypothetical protein
MQNSERLSVQIAAPPGLGYQLRLVGGADIQAQAAHASGSAGGHRPGT